MSTSLQSPKLKGPRLISTTSRIIGFGEMAQLVRSFDWSSTVLGPVETWPDALVTTVNLILASQHPMFLFWGPEHIQFYNDGYRPSIRGGKHPTALGQRAVECWGEIWSTIGPQIAAVMTKGESTWHANQLLPIYRDGKLEEVFWTYSYSPVRDGRGAIQGTLVTCSETTETVLSERRLTALLALAAQTENGLDTPEFRPLAWVAESVVSKLDRYPADIPFAALFLVSDGQALPAGSTRAADILANPDSWPIVAVATSGAPTLLNGLPESLGEVIRDPWPEPIKQAYLLPFAMGGSSVQLVLVFGISPRLTFDDHYETFLKLVGGRVAALLQEEVSRQERFRAAQRFRRLTAANPFGAMIGDIRCTVTYVNPSFLATLGYSEAEVRAGKVRWSDLTPPEYTAADARALDQLQNSGRCEVYEKEYLAKDGRRIPILIGASTLDLQDGNRSEVAAFVTDLTTLKAAEEALREANNDLEKRVAERTSEIEAEVAQRERTEMSLRELTGRLFRAQDDERRRMARDLHDHAGQTLVALSMNLSALKAAAGDSLPELDRLADEGQQLSENLSREIRTVSYLLHPPLLDEVGLGSALSWYVEGFSQRSKIKVDLILPPNLGRFPNDVEIVLFRVVQESLTNVHRHSGSPSATICLRKDGNTLQLEIRDQGNGISEERRREMVTAHVGVGVRGMEERVRQLSGTLRIDSNESGTAVIVTLPLLGQ